MKITKNKLPLLIDQPFGVYYVDGLTYLVAWNEDTQSKFVLFVGDDRLWKHSYYNKVCLSQKDNSNIVVNMTNTIQNNIYQQKLIDGPSGIYRVDSLEQHFVVAYDEDSRKFFAMFVNKTKGRFSYATAYDTLSGRSIDDSLVIRNN